MTQTIFDDMPVQERMELVRDAINSPAFIDLLLERRRQDAKWGEQNHDPFLYITILGEEFGELCQAALHLRFGSKKVEAGSVEAFELLREEAVQTAAVAQAIVECIDRGLWQWGSHASPEQ